ncbi:ATPase [Solimonas fluminis]|uniref:histidine kinase n=1 Tax=Solimonas fluminis TaxID=2086571 RepID=A0A2S5TIC2_9GAMM|nr:ATP-binding protein [Solimonas fluminis]PPE74733.1 ATPase [Solimonas fluminis]
MTAESSAPRPEDWRVLSALGLYRLSLVSLLLVLHQSGFGANFFQQFHSDSFRLACYSYAILALFLLLLVVYRSPRLQVQAHVHFAGDLAMVTWLVYATGGVPEGLGVLLLTPIIGCSLILTPRMAVLQAAIATLTMFGEETIRQLQQLRFDASDYTQTGVLGLMLFAINMAANTVAQRARRSEAIAERVGSEFANLSRLNESIIEAMQTGVLVVDAGRRIRTVNAAARRLLGRSPGIGRLLSEDLPRLEQQLRLWQDNDPGALQPFSENPHGQELLLRFTRLGWGAQAPVLVLIDSAGQLREQAQQMKLAALGRLSASIAHEIRNPLSAITHAGQLLAESSEIQGENQRLLGMIQRHSGRIDKIVRDVLELSRRDDARQETLVLRDWLQRTIAVYQEGYPQSSRALDLLDVPASLQVRFDPGHLQQVLFNLWDNSFEHGAAAGGPPRVLMHAERLDNGRIYLEIADNGPGISQDLSDKVFEPFFTTHSAGTGLGLYLAREICEYNHSRLQLVPQTRGACFRILFSMEPRE